MPSLVHVTGAETSAAEVSNILNRDGAVVVEGAMEPGLVAVLNADLDRFSEDIGVGLRHPASDFFVDFYGTSPAVLTDCRQNRLRSWRLCNYRCCKRSRTSC